MTPYRGVGGNIALKDAALLTSQLLQVHRGEKPLLNAIADYEASMREYAFAAVSDSLKAMKQFTGEKKYPAFSIFKTGMRVANAMPKLKEQTDSCVDDRAKGAQETRGRERGSMDSIPIAAVLEIGIVSPVSILATALNPPARQAEPRLGTVAAELGTT